MHLRDDNRNDFLPIQNVVLFLCENGKMNHYLFSYKTKINQQEINKKQELLLKNVPQGMEFKLSNGKVIHNIYELIEALKNEPDEVINQHINENKNDFASWVRFVIGNQELADIMEKAKDKMSLLITLKGYFS